MSTDHDLLTSAKVPYQTPRLERVAAALGERFRLPTEDDAPPPATRMVGLSFWAAACAFVGLIPAGRLAVTLLFGGDPGWYAPAAMTLGVLGVSLIAAAFAAIHRAHLPWYLLALATILLAANVSLVYLV